MGINGSSIGMAIFGGLSLLNEFILNNHDRAIFYALLLIFAAILATDTN